MKRRLLRAIIATLLTTSLNNGVFPPVYASSNEKNVDVKSNDAAARFELYAGSSARWIVDRLHGVVYAYSLENVRPLWSRDGVVFRLNAKRSNLVISELNQLLQTTRKPASEIAGRVYFFLDDVASFNKEPQRNALLVALDPRAQGRAVWELRAEEFAVFFPKTPSTLRFVAKIEALADDELLIQVQNEQAVKPFVVDAASGNVRPFH